MKDCNWVFIAHTGTGSIAWWGCIEHKSKIKARSHPFYCPIQEAQIHGTEAQHHHSWDPTSFLERNPSREDRLVGSLDRVADELHELRNMFAAWLMRQ